MIGAARYYAIRMWAPRYWPKVGADPVGGATPTRMLLGVGL